MLEITRAIPDVTAHLTLEPEQLGLKLLFLLGKRSFQRGIFSPTTLTAEICPSFPLPGQRYPEFESTSLRHVVSSAEKLCYKGCEIRVKDRVFVIFAPRSGP